MMQHALAPWNSDFFFQSLQERSKKLSAQISAQFQEMHQFLKETEQEVKALLEKEESIVVEKMQKNKSDIEEKLNTGKEYEEVIKSVIETDRPDGFLQVRPHSVSTNEY